MGLDAFKDDSELEEGSRLQKHLTCESGEVKVADEETSVDIVIPELSPDDELPDDRVKIKVTEKKSFRKYEAEIADDAPQKIEPTQEGTSDRLDMINNGPGDADLMRDKLNKR